MTAADDDQADTGPGFALPHPMQPLGLTGDTDGAGGAAATDVTDGAGATGGVTDDDAPLTPLQQAVVQDVAQGQRELKSVERFERTSAWNVNRFGLEGVGVMGALGRAVGAEKMQAVSESDDEALLLAKQAGGGDPDSSRHLVPDGGPPTPEEVHEAEMNPWPHHNMAETIEHNRQIRAGSSEPADSSDASTVGDADSAS